MARFKKGESGNPKGRPAGIKDRRTALRALLEPHAEKLVEKAREMALEGDGAMLRLCLERLIPPLKARDEGVSLPQLAGQHTPTEHAALLVQALANGELSPGEAGACISALVGAERVRESDELERRLAALEAAVAKTRGPTA